MSQGDGIIEIDSDPPFQMGEKVRIRKLVRNDGTFPGKEVGVTLAKKGDVGYIVSIGTFLQAYYIYAVHFIESGHVIGCRTKELESVDPVMQQQKAQQENDRWESWDHWYEDSPA